MRSGVLLAVAALVLVVATAATTFALTSGRERDDAWPLRVAVVGDSMAAGEGTADVWPTLLARRTGWAVANSALPDTGFVADGAGGHSFTSQVDRALATDPDVVVIAVGQGDNSRSGDTAAIQVGARDAINKAIRAGSRVLVIGPTWYGQTVPSAVRRVSDAVEEVANETGTPFLDARDAHWLTEDLMTSDRAAPNDKGQAVLAEKIGAWMQGEVDS